MSLTLYLHPLSSFCHKVLNALYERGTPFTPRIIDFGNPQDRADLLAVWPMGKFPVLLDEARGRAVPESTAIIEYLDWRFPGAPPLLPADAEARFEARLWDRVLDQHVHAPMQRIVADRLRAEHERDARGVSDAKATITTAYGVLERQLARAEWAAGPAFTIADCAAAPALFYASIVVPFPAVHGTLAGYFDRLMRRPSVERTLADARPWFRFYPYRDDIPERFR